MKIDYNGVIDFVKYCAKGLGTVGSVGVPAIYASNSVMNDALKTGDLSQALWNNKYSILGNLAAIGIGSRNPVAALGLGVLGDISDVLLRPSSANAEKAKSEPKQETKQEMPQKQVTPQGNVYTPNRKKSKSGVLYSDAVVGSDEYNAIKSSKDFARSYRDYADRKDLSDQQKEQRAVADIMAYYKQKKVKNE